MIHSPIFHTQKSKKLRVSSDNIGFFFSNRLTFVREMHQQELMIAFLFT